MKNIKRIINEVNAYKGRRLTDKDVEELNQITKEVTAIEMEEWLEEQNK